MPTVQKLDVAYAHAQALHAALSAFALDTLDPSARAMWSGLSLSAETITRAIEDRRQQLLQRQATIAQAEHASHTP